MLISEKGLKQGCWKLGQIESVYVSKDWEIRSAIVKTINGHILTRHINELCPLECGPEISQEKKLKKHKKLKMPKIVQIHPFKRKKNAAIVAFKKLQLVAMCAMLKIYV